MLDRETLLVFGITLPGLLGLISLALARAIPFDAGPLRVWGVALLVASGNQAFLLAIGPNGPGLAVANALFLAWVVMLVWAAGTMAGRRPRVGRLAMAALLAWTLFATSLAAGELALGRLLNWPIILGLFATGMIWVASDRRRRMPLASGLLVAGFGMEFASLGLRLVVVAMGDTRSLVMLGDDSIVNGIVLLLAILGLIVATTGMMLAATDGLSRRLRFALETDALTRLASRHAFFEATASLGQQPVARGLVMVDVDHFKAVNDRYGHAAGDEALRHVGRVLRETLPEGTLAARLGGEEFAALLPPIETSSTPEWARRVCEAIRGATMALPDGGTLCLSVSVGWTVAEGPVDALLRDADRALYDAKRAGRDRVMPPPDLAEGGRRP